MKKFTLFFSALLFSMMSFAGVVTFNPLQDKGNAGSDSQNATAFEITKTGVTLACSQGVVSSQGDQYRFFKNQTVTITSTVGNITSVEFTCTANGDTKYGPGGFTVTEGTYGHDGGKIGTWTGSATEVVFTASVNQVRATQVVVTIDGEGGETPDQPETPEEPETPETPDTPAPEGVITCAEAVAICEATGETATTETYTIRGYVTEIKTAYSEQYGNISFWMADTPDGGKVLQGYRVKPVNDADINVAVGDYVEVVGTLVNFMSNTPEVNQGGTYTIITTGSGETPEEPETPVTPENPEGVITCAEAVAICEATGETATTETYTIRGYVTEIKTAYSEQYGNISFWMADTPDGGKVLQGYRVKPVNDADINVAVGDYVEVVGTLVNFMSDTPEVNQGGTYTIITKGSGETPEEPETPDTPVNPGTTTIEIPAEAQGWNIPAEAIDVLQARAICAGLASGETTGTKYYVMGYVKKIHSKHADGVANYGNAQFYMENVKGANSQEDFMAYQVYGPNGEKITDPNTVAVGDFVVVYGELTNYMGDTYETVGKGAAYIWNSTNPLLAGGETPDTDVVNVKDLAYADAYYYEYEGVAYYDIDLYKGLNPDTYEIVYPEVYLIVEAKSKTALNGTYDLLYAGLWTSANDSIEMGDEVGTLTIKNTDVEGNMYSFIGSYVGTDGKTYKFDQVVNVYAMDADADYEEIILTEETTDDPVTPPTPPTTDGAVTFDADVDQGNATTDYNLAGPFQVTKSGVTLDVTKGCLGVYNNESHYRIYKNETLTLTSTVGKIVKVEFTCTANNDEKYGPGCFTVDGGEYTYSDAVGTWTGSADKIVFTASSNQVRATQVVVTLESTGTGVEDVVTVEVPVKVIENGQLMIIRGENVYNVLGAQVK